MIMHAILFGAIKSEWNGGCVVHGASVNWDIILEARSHDALDGKAKENISRHSSKRESTSCWNFQYAVLHVLMSVVSSDAT